MAIRRPHALPGGERSMSVIRLFGWECPKCRRVHAPWVPECDCHEKDATTPMGMYKLCLKCNTTYGDGQKHSCVRAESSDR